MSAANPKVGFVSLGCPKALVDSERILTQLRVEGYDLVQSYDDADVVVVNTCGFIDAAVEESLDAIGEAMAENGRVIVTGCLGKREALIREAHPGVLSISGPQDYASVMTAVHAAAPCPVEVKRAMIDWWGPVIHEYYASTEGAGATFIDSAG